MILNYDRQIEMETPAPYCPSLFQYYPDVERHRLPVGELLRRAGTPLFLGDRSILQTRYRELTTSLAKRWGDHLVGYSFKTNYLVAESRVFQEMGAWAEVVSQREYELARRLGYPGARIILNGPHKPDVLLSQALHEGALINLNDANELERLGAIAATANIPARVGLRLSSALPRLGHSRFGFSLENDEAASAVEAIDNTFHLQLEALHTHAYGDTDDAEIYALAAGRMASFAKEHISDYGTRLQFIDVGGGYPAHSPKPKSRTEWSPQPIDHYVNRISAALKPFFRHVAQLPTLVVEPGRYLTCDGIILATQVIHTYDRDGKQVVNCDGSISMVPLTHYCPQIIRPYTPQLIERTENEVPTTIHGATCRENDLLYSGLFPRVERGDYLFHFAAGAYNSSLSPDFIFAAPKMELF